MKSCKQMSSKKYTNRAEPPFNANKCKLEFKFGNDKRLYRSMKKKNNKGYKWNLISGESSGFSHPPSGGGGYGGGGGGYGGGGYVGGGYGGGGGFESDSVNMNNSNNFYLQQQQKVEYPMQIAIAKKYNDDRDYFVEVQRKPYSEYESLKGKSIDSDKDFFEILDWTDGNEKYKIYENRWQVIQEMFGGGKYSLLNIDNKTIIPSISSWKLRKISKYNSSKIDLYDAIHDDDDEMEEIDEIEEIDGKRKKKSRLFRKRKNKSKSKKKKNRTIRKKYEKK